MTLHIADDQAYRPLESGMTSYQSPPTSADRPATDGRPPRVATAYRCAGTFGRRSAATSALVRGRGMRLTGTAVERRR